MSSAYWYQYATTSNRIKQTYVNGFLDISGDLVVRNNNFNINGLISQNTDTAATNTQYTYISWNDVSGTFATVGNPTFSNNITVNQNTKTASLSVTGDSSLNKLFLNGNLAVGKTDVTSGTTLDVSGVALVSSKLSINNATYASMTNSSNNTRVLVTGDSTGTNADVSGQVVLTGSTDINSRMGFMLDTSTTNFPIGKIQVNQTNVGGGQRLALNPAGGKVGISAVPDASGTQLEVAGGIASKEPTTGNAGMGTFVKTMTAGNWYKLAQCGDPQAKVTFRVVGLVTYQNNSYNIDVTTTQSSGTGLPISSILLNNTIGSNVFTDANIDFVVVYDSGNQTSSYYIKCNSNAVYCALTIYVTTKNANGTYSKLRFYQDRVFTLSYASTISTSVDTELSGSITQFVISTHANTTYPMVVSSAGNVGIRNNNPVFALDISGTTNIGLTNGGVGLSLNGYSSTLGPYLSLKHNGSSGREWRIGSTGSDNSGGAGLLQFYDTSTGAGGWRLQIGTAGGLQIKQPEYRDATMSFGSTITKSGIEISGEVDESDALCIGLWGDTAGNNGTGYIQSISNSTTSKDLLLNPLGGNIGIGKTNPSAALDVKQPQYREATMSFANTFTKSGIKISGDLDNTDGLCIGLWGTPTGQATAAGDNGTGYIQNIWDTAGTPLAKDLLLNPLGGNVAIGKTTAGVPLDIEGAIQFRTTSKATIGIMNCGNGEFLSIEAYNLDNSIKRPILLAPYGGKVGIGITNPAESLHASGNVRATQYRFNDILDVYMTTYSDNIGFYGTNNTLNGYIEDDGPYVANIDFTGQHRAFVKNVHVDTLECFIGLIVVADNNKYFSIDNHVETGLNSIKINESIPFCSLSKKENDKRVFGVISGAEDAENRVYSSGKFFSVFKKQVGDTRIHINSLGEGAIWVSNKNGNLESGDYITSSSIPGYGMKQDSEYLCNYTVAKITMDCDFNPLYQHTQTILKDSNGNNVLDNNNEIKWTDKVDSSGNFVYEYAYEIRYILPDGTIITKEQYNIKKGNNESVYIAAFVGCTYHCG